VAAAEEQWSQSEKTNNVDLLAPLLADKFILIDIDGTIMNRAQELADAKATKYTSEDADELHITVFGNTAVATMIFKAKGTDSKGKPMDVHARWADTYVKMPDGKWQCVLSQGSDLKKESNHRRAVIRPPGETAAGSLDLACRRCGQKQA
jgi:ketosteroid isomerase-like protein